jgi:hypothetical protein
MFCFF